VSKARRRKASEPPWYKTAVFYEVHVRGFFDANDDGTGDLRGLAQRLDYLAFLGIDCLCLLPIYASALRHSGYDPIDLVGVHPDYGTTDDLKSVVDAAHDAGMKIVLDLALNHTSSDHPWFQESRADGNGPRADWYVWSDVDGSEAEAGLWTFDPVRGQYYRHRFADHQPELNYASEDVREQGLAVVRHWLGLGLDGFRLDALPYCFGRDEDVEQTHAYLKQIRGVIDRHSPGGALMVQASRWPDEAAQYFGDGDEAHVASHYPLMQRMFVAMRREDGRPLYEILEQTPPTAETAAWSFFLRMNDELTLDLVTDEERDYLYADYAKDPKMKRNLGTRRRLAPLLDNGRDEIELLYAILFSLPGSSVLYYGDEIGMGDNPTIGASDGVRTPMQWTGDRNGGFSRADWAHLYLQPLMDPVYGYQAVNVEAQLRTPTSLLSWLRRFLALRKEHPVFGLGSYEPLGSDNTRIFAHIRRWADETVICVHNLASSAQPVQLDLGAFQGRVPEEMFGPTQFPAIGELPYLLTLKPRGFFWFRLT
jgi:maltose alpha-D-glucosyltransferase / alpha-amylase